MKDLLERLETTAFLINWSLKKQEPLARDLEIIAVQGKSLRFLRSITFSNWSLGSKQNFQKLDLSTE